jgi:tetratricopeptide (TPR) repeat protein
LSEDILKKLYERGVSAFQADHAEIALLYFTFLSMVDAKNSQIWLMKGMSAQNSGHYDEALAAYNMAISLDPNFLAAYIQTINCLILANHLDAARAAYELFMHEVDPQEYIHNPYIIEKLDTIKNCLHQTV